MKRTGQNFYIDKESTDSLTVSDENNTLTKLTLTVKTMSLFPKVVLEREVASIEGSMHTFHFIPDDTKNIREGKYIYTVMGEYADGTVRPLIKNRLFVVM